MRILKPFPLLLALALCLSACAGKDPGQEDQSAFTWKMEILQTVWSDGLFTVKQSTQYDGSTIKTGYEHSPGEGQAFLLLELRVYKDQAGGPAFSWDEVALEDGNGQAYPRMSDGFLTEFDYDRLPGTNLRLKENRGWICFQVPVTPQEQAWTLTHSTDEGKNAVKLPAEENGT